MGDTNMNSTDELEESGYKDQVDPNQALEDPYDFLPRVVTQTPGTIEDIQQKLRIGGLALRRHYNESLNQAKPRKVGSFESPSVYAK
jgi:hypothetical protein